MIYAPSTDLFASFYEAYLTAWGRCYAALSTYKSRQRLTGEIRRRRDIEQSKLLFNQTIRTECEQARAELKRTKRPDLMKADPIHQLCGTAADTIINLQDGLATVKKALAKGGYTGNPVDAINVILAELAERKQRDTAQSGAQSTQDAAAQAASDSGERRHGQAAKRDA
jgi:hypothetical protein